MKKKTYYWGLIMVLPYTLLICSCKDSILAKELEGTWTTSFITSYDDGTKSYIDEQITFKKDDPNKDGGTFFEIRTGKEELDEDEDNIKYRWISKIEGTWEINIEDLVLHYNISTLDVEVGKEDVDFKLKNEALGKALLNSDLGSLIMGGMYLNNNLYKELKKGTYKDMFRYYKKINDDTNNNGVSFPEIQIDESIMSYETSDMGRIKYTRVDGKPLNNEKTNRKNGSSPKRENDVSSLSGNQYPDNDYEESEYSYHFSGYIDKYEIEMFLNIDDDKVDGYYYYGTQGPDKRIYLSGQYINKDDGYQLSLRCDNQDTFDGISDDYRYSGEFTNTNNKRLSFNLRIMNE